MANPVRSSKRPWLPFLAAAIVAFVVVGLVAWQTLSREGRIGPISLPELTAGGVESTATPVPEARRVRLRVQVLDAAGQPVPQTALEVRDRHNKTAALLETGPGGDALGRVPAGEGYTVTARKAGYALARLTDVNVEPSGATARLTLEAGPSGAPPAAGALGGPRLFVGHVTPRLTLIDPASNLPLRTSDALGSGRSTLLALSRDRSRLYTTWAGGQQVFVLDSGDFALLDTIELDSGRVTALAVHPTTDRLWIASQQLQAQGASAAAELLELGSAGSQAVRQFEVPAPVSGLLFRADGRLLYLLHRASNAVSLFRVGTGEVVSTFRVGQWPAAAALSADGATLYVVNLGSDRMVILNAESGERLDTVEVGQGASAILPHPDGTRVFVANQPLGYVQTVDLKSHQVTDLIPVGRNPSALALRPGGGALYVANSGSGTVSLVDLSKQSVTDTITVGGSPQTLLLAQ